MSASSIPISKTKIIVPSRRQEMLSRPRLIESLQSSLEHKLVLLSAAAGFGKTSLLIDLARTIKMPVSWLSLDQLDRDPQRFMAYLIASLAERFPGVGASSQNLLNNLKTIESDAEALLVTLTNELYDQVEDDYVLILDDYHLLDDVPVISTLVNRFLQLVDENCHLIIASRTLPDLDDVTLMVAREQVAGLSQADLAFQIHEIQALYAQNHHENLSDERAKQILEGTGGWITGMVLSNSSDMQVSGVDTFAYLGSQVLNQQPANVREFLIRTSLLEEFNADLCEVVLGPFYSQPENWLALMGLILEKNLFVLPLGEDGRWLRYHPVFREFLQSRLHRERPHEIEPMLERMVKAYEAAGDWEKAYFTCKQLENFDALAEVIQRAGTHMLQSALITLEGWINSLPPVVLRSHPGLVSLRGVISAMKGNLPEAHALLDTAVESFRRDGKDGGLALALVRRANTLRLLGQYSVSNRDIAEVMQLTETSLSPEVQAIYAEALRIKGLNSYRLGESRNAIEDLQHSLSLYTELKESDSIPLLMTETAMVQAAVGDIDAAQQNYQKSLELFRKEKKTYFRADTLNNLAVMYLQIGDYEQASETFEDGLVCARTSRHLRAEALILTGLGDLYNEIGEFGASSQAYEQADAIANGLSASFISNYLIIARAGLALSRNDLDSAALFLNQFKKKIKLNPSKYERGYWALFEGRRHFLLNDLKKAITYLQEGKTNFYQDGRISEYQWCIIWSIAVYEAMGRRENARAEFTELLSVQNKFSHALIFGVYQAYAHLIDLQTDPEIGRALGALLERSRQFGANLPQVRRVLRRLAQSIQMPMASLKIKGFGRPEVIVNGTAISASDWKSQSARDLFFFFLTRQEPRTKDQISLEIWVETDDPVVARNRFKQDIYRLRRAVGRQVILFDEETYRFNRDLDYEYDVEAFESYVFRAHATKDILERIGYYRKAVDLVQGAYLSDVDAGWATYERERLKIAYASALENLAQLYLETNQLSDCLKLCKLALSEDPYNEKVYQVEMRALAAQGDRTAVAVRYKEYKTTLANDLGLAPSEETEMLFRQLTM